MFSVIPLALWAIIVGYSVPVAVDTGIKLNDGYYIEQQKSSAKFDPATGVLRSEFNYGDTKIVATLNHKYDAR